MSFKWIENKMNKMIFFFKQSLLIFTITGLSCSEPGSFCTELHTQCSKNSDCCINNCRWDIFSFKSYCAEPLEVLSTVKHMFLPKVENGTCAYHIPTSKNVSSVMFKKYKVNAAHATLPHNTIVEVTYNNKTIHLTINDRTKKNNKVLLELSNEAAKELGIEHEGIVPCVIVIPVLHDYEIMGYLEYVGFFFTILILINLFT